MERATETFRRKEKVDKSPPLRKRERVDRRRCKTHSPTHLEAIVQAAVCGDVLLAIRHLQQTEKKKGMITHSSIRAKNQRIKLRHFVETRGGANSDEVIITQRSLMMRGKSL